MNGRPRRGKRSKHEIPKQEFDQLIRGLFFGNAMLNTARKHGFREYAHVSAAERHGKMLETLLQHSPAKILRNYTQFDFVEWTVKLQKQVSSMLDVLQNAIRRLVQVCQW